MPQEVKTLMLDELAEQFHDIKQTGCVLVDYRGLKADEARRIRHQMRARGARMTVVKNSLFALAMDRLGASALRELLSGPIAVVRAGDPVAAAKAVEEMTKATDAVQVRGGYVEGSLVGPDSVAKMARIPSREVLLSQVAGMLMAPLRRLAGGLLTRPRELISILEQLKEKAPPEGADRQQASEEQ
jgi:large subunit ribosomal protein L10